MNLCINYFVCFGRLEHALVCITLIYVLNAEAMAFDGDRNEEVGTYLSRQVDSIDMPPLSGRKKNTDTSETACFILQSIDVKVQKALECPCLDDLKKGPCGSPFIVAFSCYLKSTEEEKVESSNF